MRQRKLYFPEPLSGKISYEIGRNIWLSGFWEGSGDGEGRRVPEQQQVTANGLGPHTAVLCSGVCDRCSAWSLCRLLSSPHSSASPPNKCGYSIRRNRCHVLHFETIRSTFILIIEETANWVSLMPETYWGLYCVDKMLSNGIQLNLRSSAVLSHPWGTGTSPFSSVHHLQS